MLKVLLVRVLPSITIGFGIGYLISLLPGLLQSIGMSAFAIALGYWCIKSLREVKVIETELEKSREELNSVMNEARFGQVVASTDELGHVYIRQGTPDRPISDGQACIPLPWNRSNLQPEMTQALIKTLIEARARENVTNVRLNPKFSDDVLQALIEALIEEARTLAQENVTKIGMGAPKFRQLIDIATLLRDQMRDTKATIFGVLLLQQLNQNHIMTPSEFNHLYQQAYASESPENLGS